MAEAIDWAKIREEGVGRFALAALPPTLKLPALPLAVTRFTEKAANPDVPLRELAAIIQTETGLTTELLRHVNSAHHGLRSKASNVVQAMNLLGLRQAKSIILATGVQAAVRAGQSKLINQGCFWNACLQKALFSREVALLLKTDAETAFVGALLQDFLLPVLTSEMLEPYLRFTSDRESQPSLICDFERAEFGFDHAVAAACLAHRWNLPDELVCCILYHHQGLRILVHPVLKRSPVAAVALSALLPDQLRQEFSGLEQLIKLQEKWPAFDLRALVEKVDALHAQSGLGVRNDFPLSERCRSIFAATERTPEMHAAACRDGSLRSAARSVA